MHIAMSANSTGPWHKFIATQSDSGGSEVVADTSDGDDEEEEELLAAPVRA